MASRTREEHARSSPHACEVSCRVRTGREVRPPHSGRTGVDGFTPSRGGRRRTWFPRPCPGCGGRPGGAADRARRYRARGPGGAGRTEPIHSNGAITSASRPRHGRITPVRRAVGHGPPLRERGSAAAVRGRPVDDHFGGGAARRGVRCPTAGRRSGRTVGREGLADRWDWGCRAEGTRAPRGGRTSTGDTST
ncbi:hypothetical protein KCH_03160 [Kitasatospora cheerisanensis KCTC 2395]|uniref:Uncharacterized protein n=1 Tax=Kitasatospora cheerisanensis KCTC 2395 TaxID=1348663 RepID=A0A066Z297_9ACTN|nr:hypothetical protein KCH_03160 [Kitasatospora cheerisanensis KCTC 2395]